MLKTGPISDALLKSDILRGSAGAYGVHNYVCDLFALSCTNTLSPGYTDRSGSFADLYRGDNLQWMFHWFILLRQVRCSASCPLQVQEKGDGRRHVALSVSRLTQIWVYRCACAFVVQIVNVIIMQYYSETLLDLRTPRNPSSNAETFRRSSRRTCRTMLSLVVLGIPRKGRVGRSRGRPRKRGQTWSSSRT